MDFRIFSLVYNRLNSTSTKNLKKELLEQCFPETSRIPSTFGILSIHLDRSGMYILQNIFNRYILIFKKNGISYRHNEGFKNCPQLFSHLNNYCQFAVSVAQETSIIDVS